MFHRRVQCEKCFVGLANVMHGLAAVQHDDFVRSQLVIIDSGAAHGRLRNGNADKTMRHRADQSDR
ncbi:hypothetical protein D3C78_1419110 [compost metagenome]